ncbi:HSF-type DNA-binding protein [Nitzschia inconspicua]|uniref:HSF-type DNA-binding protein n=1 Tax=Nitzschia inconspicua TaxID=303405 RepID=A0A9K3PJP0_9STRA|nr:HSF-type DNA-binding protein [Nitzschia inconspicua]
MCTTGTRRRLRRNRGGSESQFPGKLYDLLEYVSENDLESAICWARNGTAIMVHDPDKLVEILPKFFGQTKYRSFRRQLNMWHFHRIMEGPYRGAFMHPCFIRGNKQLLTYMSRHVYAATASPTTPSHTNFTSSDPGRSFEEWQSQQQQQNHQPPLAMQGIMHPFLQHHLHHPQSVARGTSCDNVLLSSLDPQLSSMEYSYDVAPQSHSSIDERIKFEPSAICLTESPVQSSTNKFKGFSIDHLNDGDPISFAGRRFHYVDYSSPQKKSAEEQVAKAQGKPFAVGQRNSSSPSHREEHVGLNVMDAFANDAPMIVSDALLEPITSEIIDSIFATMTDNDL